MPAQSFNSEPSAAHGNPVPFPQDTTGTAPAGSQGQQPVDTIAQQPPGTLPQQLPDSITGQPAGTLMQQLPDTIAGQPAGTLMQQLPDTTAGQPAGTPIQQLPDTTALPITDTLAQPPIDSLPLSPAGTPIQQPPGTPVIAPAGTTGISRPDTVSVTPARAVMTPPGAAEIREVDTGMHPAPERSDIFIRESVITELDSADDALEVRFPVFIETVQSPANRSAEAYRAYLVNDMTENENGPILFTASWIPALVILSFLVLTWIKVVYVQFLTPVLFSAFNYKKAQKLYHEKSLPAQNAFMMLQVILAINGGLFLLFVSDYFDFYLPGISMPLLFLIFSLAILVLFWLKSFALRITGFLFDKSKLFAEYRHNVSLYNKIYGLLLLPVVVGLLYGGDSLYVLLIYSGLALLAVFYLLQLVRGLEIIIRKGVSLFYLFLYLCALEILPIIVLYKLVQLFLYS